MTPRRKVVLFTGFGGGFLSQGMAILADKIKESATVDDVELYAYDHWKHTLDNALKNPKDKLILIGHSFGALAIYKIADQLETTLPLLISFDYSPFYSGILKKKPDGIVPANVKQALNFYQDIDLLVRGMQLKREDGSLEGVSNIRAERTHIGIAKDDQLHSIVLRQLSNK